MPYVYVLIGVVVLAALVFVGVQARRYGGVKAAFSSELKTERQVLAKTRSQVKSLTKARDAELKEARRGVDEATARRDGAIAGLQARIADYDNPGMGAPIDGVGDVRVFEHAVQVGAVVLPLAGARAEVKVTPDSAMIFVTAADGRSAMRAFDTRFRAVGDPKAVEHGSVVQITQQQKRDHSPEEVYALQTFISNAVIAEEQWLLARPANRAAAAAELERVVADTSEVDAMTAQLQEVEAGTETLAALDKAKSELELVEAIWKESRTAVGAATPTS